MTNVETVIANLNEFVPEAMEQARLRFRVLRDVLHHQPVGRRQIAQRLGRSERTARSEIGALKEQGALEITPGGILLTDYGMKLISMMDVVVPYLEGLNPLASRLKQYLGLDEVILVSGDSYIDPLTKKELGRVAARYVKEALLHARILAVTGGSTLAEMGNAITPGPGGHEVLVLPARGGLGERLEEQANAIAAHIAKAMGGNYRLLHIPDSLDQETIDRLMTNQQIAEIVSQLKQCDIVVHGIGSALEMASRRGLAEEALKILEDHQAVGEAFRYYFNAAGEIVYNVAGIGLELSDLDNVSLVVAVAGGSNKAWAIESVLTNRRRGTLISDEGAARTILERRR